nr:unnamed protein product [Callosobruchus chinensis]
MMFWWENSKKSMLPQIERLL